MTSLPDDVTRMYGVADDYESSVLDGLRERAGITWEHEGCWTNMADDEACGACGRPRAEVARRV